MIAGRVGARRAIPWPPLAAVALVAALSWPAQLVLHACLPGAGPVGWLGLRLALLSASADCPDGALAIGGTGTSGAIVIATVAVPTLLAHLLAVVGGVSLSAALSRAAAGVRAVLATVVRVLPDAPRARRVRAVAAGVVRLARPPRRAWTVGHLDRGPPRGLLAA
ncbi:hypothetical protein [Pengzhenrongella sicca]|uniref:Uncharacterized protein n=1 Tax=Pengzhenrongella sicca TaxID=2819238 RepID=A0A8A4ZD34_9MICO|nr:hypothetical protein [Pengzhenrongella sicca]QTE29824.1 hypothetical protein J4E96_01960 [Pengzhenrongella sicca]